MACVSATGELTTSGRTILEVLRSPTSVEDISRATGLPVFRTRAALREFLAAGFAAETAPGVFGATPSGVAALGEPVKV